MDNELYKQLGILAFIGLAMGLGKDMREGKINRKDLQKVIGRALVSALMAFGAAVIWLIYPNAPFLALCGVAALLVLFGELFVIKRLEAYFDKDK